MTTLPTSTPAFPVVDISPFLFSSPSKRDLWETARHLSSACAYPGFFYLVNHNLDERLTSQVLDCARQFFLHASDEEKSRIKRKGVGEDDGDGARGYQVIGDNVTEGKKDFHEAIDWYRPVKPGEPHASVTGNSNDTATANGSIADRKPPYDLLQGLNAWPTSPPNFRSIYEEYIDKMLELGTAVIRAMGMALGNGMEETLVQNTRESWWVMRAIGYPPLPEDRSINDAENEGGVSCGAHSDYGCVTLLLSDDTKGALQAWVEDGAGKDEGRWINIDPMEGAVVVNIGDMLARWSGGRWKATRHRVVHRGEGYRVSVPFFFEPDWHAKVPGESGEGEVVYGEYLREKVWNNF